VLPDVSVWHGDCCYFDYCHYYNCFPVLAMSYVSELMVDCYKTDEIVVGRRDVVVTC